MKNNTSFNRLIAFVLVGGLSLMLGACGGNTSDGDASSPGTTLSGLVAGDAASAGTVTLRDASGQKVVSSTDPQDAFQFDVGGLAAPYTVSSKLRNGKTLVAVADGPGVVSVDPISTAAFRGSGSGSGSDDDKPADSTRQVKFGALLEQLRTVMAPLFTCYGITSTTSPRDPAWKTFYAEVRFEIDDGVLTVTNRQSGTVIFTGQMSALSQGTFTEANVPARCSGSPAPAACTSITYSDWGTCQSNGTQTRTVTSVTPSGCDQSAAELTQACTPATTAALSSLSVSPASVTGGSSSTGTVTLTAAAPAGGTAVTLSSSSASATVPASVTVLAGATTATFAVATTSVATATSVTITASAGGVNRTATLTVNAPAALVCSNCHGTSGPTSGRHVFHVQTQGYACSTCHGTGYSFTAQTVNTATHQNGTVDVTVSNWNPTTKTCGGCHSAGSRTW